MDANLIFFYLQVGEFSIIIVADFSVDKNSTIRRKNKNHERQEKTNRIPGVYLQGH